ncbi:MAG TPA: hypothetical protein VFR41_10700, partial [Acidimicrobiia bacterium]|nr:hypothetical protein [Acidimicrobiia bacterium]
MSTDARAAREDEIEAIAAALEQLVAAKKSSEPAPIIDLTACRLIAGARHSGRLLGNLVLSRGYATPAEVEAALARQKVTGRKLGETLIEMGAMTEAMLADLLAEQLRMSTIDLDRVAIDRTTARRLRYTDARAFGAIAIQQRD